MDVTSVIVVGVQIATTVAVIVFAISAIIYSDRSLKMIFFTVAMMCGLLSNLYWIAYDILMPEMRMPFAANEIGEWAMFLLLGASLMAAFPEKRVSVKWEMTGAAVFIAANTVLWILWSGEWIQDILTGLSMGYLLCCIVAALRRAGVISVPGRIATGAVCLVTVGAQAAWFFVPDGVREIIDFACPVIIMIYLVFVIIKTIVSLAKGSRHHNGWYLSFLAFAMALIGMYMSTGIYYIILMAMATVSVPLMFLAVRKEGVKA